MKKKMNIVDNLSQSLKQSLLFVLCVLATMPFMAKADTALVQKSADASGKSVASSAVLIQNLAPANNTTANDKKTTGVTSSMTVTAAATRQNVAILTVFSDPTFSNVLQGYTSSDRQMTYDTGAHSWIMVTNVSNTNIVVGPYYVAPGKSMTIGKWGLGDPHSGLWYNRESSLIYKWFRYPNRVSASWLLTQTMLSRLNSMVSGNDNYYWQTNNNCATFAAAAWNSVVPADGGYAISAGTVFPSTPKKLAASIMSQYSSYYRVGASVPYNYVVSYGWPPVIAPTSPNY